VRPMRALQPALQGLPGFLPSLLRPRHDSWLANKDSTLRHQTNCNTHACYLAQVEH